MIIVSACLAGLRTRYEGAERRDDDIARMVEEGEALALCPEVLGGLATPRPPAEITGEGDGAAVLDGAASVTDLNGRDVTPEFIAGAKESLRIARSMSITHAILKDKSPSCGVERIYKQGRLSPGMGVTAALFKRHGIQVVKRS